MASHKHSFQCFDAVVEKSSFTAGHNFVLPHTSTFASTHLEQLENRRCSLCSESQQAMPVTSEVSGNQSALWFQAQSPGQQHTPRRPMRPEGDLVDSVAHHNHNQRHQYHTHKHCKRIVLVKNSNPSIQKTILLHHKPVHSLSVFMDDVSDLMHCLIRKLYTLDGRKVDSIQSLLQGPGVLVCVGREPFHPLFKDCFQKNSEDKLPKLILKPQSNTCKEDQGYKKNGMIINIFIVTRLYFSVNNGVKSKKSPDPYPKARKNTLDEDIEKRVLVNKDGSLSMEMKVRFRLLNDETLHCSTKIKKSSCTFNVSFPGQNNVYSPHGSYGESCSAAESLSASDIDDVCISKLYQKNMEEPHCQHCCTHCEKYDIWNDPALSEQETLGHIGSSCSSAPSHKIKCKKDSFDSIHTTSCEEYTEQVVEKETCIQQTVVEGDNCDNIVRYRTISRCCSRSGVCSVTTKAKKAGYVDEKHEENESPHACTEKVPSKKIQHTREDERPLSVETNSSDILATFKEDEDNDERDISTSQSIEENDEKNKNTKVSPYSFTPSKPLESPKQPLSTRASSTASCCSVKSKSFRRFIVRETQETVDQDKKNAPSSPPHECQQKESIDVAMENDISEEKFKAIIQSEDFLYTETGMRTASDLSKTCDDISVDTVETSQSNKNGRSKGLSTPPNRHAHLNNSNNSVIDTQEFLEISNSTEKYLIKEENIEVTSLATFADSDTYQSPVTKNKSEEPADAIQDERIASSMSPKSNDSTRSSQSRLSIVACKETRESKLQNWERTQTEISVDSTASTIAKQSTVTYEQGEGTEDQAREEMPHALSMVSQSSQMSDLKTSEFTGMKDSIEDRSPSIMSVKSSVSEATSVNLLKVESSESLKSALSIKTNTSDQSRTSKVSAGMPVDMDTELLKERVPSVMSGKSDVSVKTKPSYIFDSSPYSSNGVKDAIENCAPSAKSNNSNIASRSNTTMVSTMGTEEADLLEEKRLKRPSSVMCSKSCKSAPSVRSANTKTGDGKDNNTAENIEQLQRYKKYKNVMPSNFSDSDLSKGAKTSGAMPDKSDDFKDKSEEQATSTMFTKSSTPTQSNKSEMLETAEGGIEGRPLSKLSSVSKELEKCMILETARQCNHTEKRPTCIMSSTGMSEKEERSPSAMSLKSSVSEKSEKISEAAQECDHPENIQASATSITSVESMESAVSGVPCKNVDDETKHSGQRSENALLIRSPRSRKSKAKASKKDTNKDMGNRERATSAMPFKSIFSDRSNCAIDGLDTAPTEDSLQETYAYEETKDERNASSMSFKSHMSSLSNKSNNPTQERAPTPLSAKAYVSSKSKNEKQSARRTQCTVSIKLNKSQPLMKTSVLECYEEPQIPNTKQVVERSPIAVSAKSNTFVRSKKSDTQSNRKVKKPHLNTTSPESRTSAKDERLSMSNSSPKVDDIKSEEACDIKIEQRAASSMSTRSSVSSRSMESNISALSGGQTDTENFNRRSDIALSGLKISMTDYSNNADNEERVSSALSKSSNSSVHHTSERVLTPASASVSIGIVEEYDDDNVEEDSNVSLASVHSTSHLNSKTMCCKDSSKAIENKNQQYGQMPEDSAKSSTGTIVSEISRKSECTQKNSFQATLDNEVANTKSTKKSSKKSSNHSLSSRSSKIVGRTSPAVPDQLYISNTLLHLEANGQNGNGNGKCHSADERSKSNLSGHRHFKKQKEEISRPHSADITSTTVSGKKSTEPVIFLGVSNHRSNPSDENTNTNINGSLGATDCSKNAIDNQSEKNSNSICRHSSSSLAQKAEKNSCELVPSILPSSSPREVVNEWLEKIPLDSALYDVGDEFHENCKEGEPFNMSGEVTQYGSGKESDEEADAVVPQKEHPVVTNNEDTVGDIKDTMKGHAVEENNQPCYFSEVPSSVRLMKILLSPKLDRCNSLPEVSPVYGRRLSTSARGFLDSLVNLHLLDFNSKDVNDKAEKYNDLMNMLQSLWLCDPSDRLAIIPKNKCTKQQPMNETFNVKPSSAVDLNSSSQDSGKSSADESMMAQKSQANTAGDATEILTNVQDTDTKEKTFNGIETKSDPATPDIASRSRWTPENGAEENMHVVSDLIDRRNNYRREPTDKASISNKSFGNYSTADQKPTDHKEDASSESQTSEQHSELTENVFQDHDPVWVLNLLNKMEKQFMTHYVTSMAEIKVRWNLNDNEQLDIMICELRDEVHKRIQASIQNELRKIQGHAGRPKPPKQSMSRGSSVLTNRRHRRLKVSLNHSVDPAVNADDDNSSTNDDENCPCDTCIKKKASPRPVLTMDVSNCAPKILDFDLRNILHLKRNLSSNSKKNVIETENKEQLTEVRNLVEDALLDSSKKEETNEGIEVTEGEMSESESEEEEEIYKDENKKHEDTENETTWNNMSEKPDTAEKREFAGIEKERGANHKSDGITYLEDGTVEDDTAEAEKSESTDTEQRDGNDSAKEDVYIKKISKENSEDDLLDEEKVIEPAEDGDITEHKSAEVANPMNNESAKEGETDNDKLDGEVTETTEDRETIRDNLADVGDMSEAKAKEEDEATKTSNSHTVENTSDDATDEYKETPTAKTTEITDDEKADDAVAGEAENRDTDDNETSDIAETVDSGNTTKAKTAECDEAHDDGTSEEGKSVEAVVVENEQTDEAAEENGNNNKDDERTEESERSKSEVAEEIVENEIVKGEGEGKVNEEVFKTKALKDFVGDRMNVENIQKTGPTNKEKTANAIANCKTADTIEMDTSQSDDGETAGDKTPNNNTINHGTAENGQTLYNDITADDGLSEDGETTSDSTSDDETAVDGVTPNDNTAEDEQTLNNDNTADDGPSEDEETTNDSTSDDETAVDGVTPNDNTAEDEQTLNNDNTADDGPLEDGETANDYTDDDGTAEERETTNDNTDEDGQTLNDDTADDGPSEDGETANSYTDDDGTAENRETPNDNTDEDGQTLNDDTAHDGPSEDGETVNNYTDDDGRAEERETPNDNTVENGQTLNEYTADDGPSEDAETENDDTADEGREEDEKLPNSKMEEVDETTEAETAEDNQRADGQTGDDEETGGETTTETENEENEETAEAKTEDGETADSGTTEDEETVGERKAKYDYSDNKLAPITDVTNESECLENGETLGDSNGETHERNTTEAVINTYNIKTNQNSERLQLNQDTETSGSKRFNVNIHSVNTRESDDGGDEAEDDTEPVVETYGKNHRIKIPATQPTKWPLCKDDQADKRTIASFKSTVKMYTGSEDGEDADGEDSETEVYKE
ncbi:hypothetical protein C0J50_20597, partial [Silurus asotus]